MAEVSARDLRNHTREVLERVRRGESIEITLNRRAVAELRPVSPKPQWAPWDVIEEAIREHGADRGLLEDLAFLREQRVELPED